MNKLDTITAISTPYGRGGIGIIRISGFFVLKLTLLLVKKIPLPRKAEYLSIYKKNICLDRGIVLFFPAPNSFTGEDILELHCHGGPVVLNLLIDYIISFNNVRIAYPGEFLKRSFLNKKIDLIQAESISYLINSNSIQSCYASLNSISGVFSNYINKLIKSILNLRIYIESYINSLEENINEKKKIKFILDKILLNFNFFLNKVNQGYLLNEGISVVIAGKPNVGKSSLFNAIISRDISIVTNISGTTRDILKEKIYIDGMPVKIIDTAGICNTKNVIECIGINLTWSEILKSDHIIWVIDNISNFNFNFFDILLSKLNKNIPITIVVNKADIINKDIGIKKINGKVFITISAFLKKGINILLQYLKYSFGFNNKKNFFIINKRYLNSLEISKIHLLKCKNKFLLNYPLEYLAEDLRISHQSLCEITGQFTTNDLLNKIFKNFCIGK